VFQTESASIVRNASYKLSEMASCHKIKAWKCIECRVSEVMEKWESTQAFRNKFIVIICFKMFLKSLERKCVSVRAQNILSRKGIGENVQNANSV
jgi:hypothetical protein